MSGDMEALKKQNEAMRKALKDSNEILIYVLDHGRLPQGGEDFPNRECVWEQVGANGEAMK